MLRSVNRYLNDSYIARHGSLGIVLGRHALGWHLLKIRNKQILIEATGAVELPGSVEGACQALLELFSRPELQRALTTLALTDDLCRFLVARFDNLPEAVKDREHYIRWSYGRQYQLTSEVGRLSRSVMTSVFREPQTQRPHVAIADLSGFGQQVVARLGDNNCLLHAVVPLPTIYSDCLRLRLPRQGKCLLIVIDAHSWQYFWWDDGVLLFYRTQQWGAAQASGELLIQGVQSLRKVLDSDARKSHSLMLVDSEKIYEGLPDTFKNSIDEVCRKHDLLTCASPSAEPAHASFWTAAREMGVF